MQLKYYLSKGVTPKEAMPDMGGYLRFIMGQTPHPQSGKLFQSAAIRRPFISTALFLSSLALFLAFLPIMGFSQIPPSSSAPEAIIRQKQPEPKPESPPRPMLPSSEEGRPAITTPTPQRYISGFWIEGSHVYQRRDIAPIVEPYLYHKIGTPELNDIVNALRKRYRIDGYILSRIEPIMIDGEILVLRVTEGYIKQVRIQGDVEGPQAMIEKISQKLTQYSSINLKDLERYILLINDLPGVTARGKIRNLGTADGAVEFIITLEHKPVNAYVVLSNRYSRFLGPEVLSGAVEFNSTLHQYEKIEVDASVNPLDPQELQYAALRYSQPINSEGTRIEGYASLVRTKPGAALRSFDYSGDGVELELSVSHPFVRGRRFNIVGRSGLDYIDSNSDIHSVDLYRDRIRTFFIGGKADFADRFAGVSVADMQLRKGLDIFNSSSGKTDISRQGGKNDYTSIRGSVSRIQSLTNGFSLLGKVNGQYSADALLSAEQFSIGGPSYGRAYDPGELSGDRGLASLIELRYGQTLSQPLIQDYQGYTYYDIGGVWNKNEVTGLTKQTLASAGLGLRLGMKYDTNAEVELGFPLTRSVVAEGDHGTDPRLFVTLGKKF